MRKAKSIRVISLFLSLTIIMASCQNNTNTSENDSENLMESASSTMKNENSEVIEPTEKEALEVDNNEKMTITDKTKEEPTQTASKPKNDSSKPISKSSKEVEKAKAIEEDEPTASNDSEEIPKPKVVVTPKSKAVEENVVEKEAPKEAEQKFFSHDTWDELLRKYVSTSGQVNYGGFKQDKAKLQSYLDLLADNAPTSAMSKNDQIAYWINAYNAFTVDLIVDNYPTSSILKLDGGKTWYVKRITIGGKKYSLNDIEKNILIGQFKESRVHFAINCAAQSCPPLRNRAWKGNSLNSDLARATKDFINNDKYNQISKKKANLSRIFDWYKGDFGDVNAFISQYSDTSITSKTTMAFNEYNWDLNE